MTKFAHLIFFSVLLFGEFDGIFSKVTYSDIKDRILKGVFPKLSVRNELIAALEAIDRATTNENNQRAFIENLVSHIPDSSGMIPTALNLLVASTSSNHISELATAFVDASERTAIETQLGIIEAGVKGFDARLESSSNFATIDSVHTSFHQWIYLFSTPLSKFEKHSEVVGAALLSLCNAYMKIFPIFAKHSIEHAKNSSAPCLLKRTLEEYRDLYTSYWFQNIHFHSGIETDGGNVLF